MKTEQIAWTRENGWKGVAALRNASLLLAFGGTDTLLPARIKELKKIYPATCILGCSTAGEIAGTTLQDDSIVATAVSFAKTTLKCVATNLRANKDSFAAGAALAKQLVKKDLVHVFVLSDGQKVNGSELVAGLLSALPKGVTATGGLAGDGTRFKRTLVFFGDDLSEGNIAAVGFYGKALRVGYAAQGGWNAFGPERKITKSKGNVLYELDGQSALATYKKYLGPDANGLPATGLLFPLHIHAPEGGASLVRTILNVDEKTQSLTFAGDVPEGHYAQFMKANSNRLVDGAETAAAASQKALGRRKAQLAVLVSCVGRKLVLKQRTEEELEAVRAVIGPTAAMTGFYSYGEICPAAAGERCNLHNQTMTITLFSEDE